MESAFFIINPIESTIMKKLFSLLICLSISLLANAQMSHTFFGATLGVSTKQQTVNALMSKKVNVIGNTEAGIVAENVTFDGVTYDQMFMHFYNGKLSELNFLDEGGLGCSKMNQLADKYTRKYPGYRYYFTDANSGYMLDDDAMQIIIVEGMIIFKDMKISEQQQKDNSRRFREIHPYTNPRIPTNILGCTLGVSTKQQVISTLKSKGLRVLANNDADNVIFSGTKHEGVNFGVVGAYFFQGKLVSILFMHYGQGLSQSELNTLARNLDSKYSDYDVRLMTDGQSQDGYINYNDDRVYISLWNEGLAYADWNLNQKKQRCDFRALRGKRM